MRALNITTETDNVILSCSFKKRKRKEKDFKSFPGRLSTCFELQDALQRHSSLRESRKPGNTLCALKVCLFPLGLM